MRILYYNDFHPGRHQAEVEKALDLLRRDELRAADLKKLAPTPYYRARLNYADRLLLQIVSYGGERCALVLEVIEKHAYEKSRFMRGARIDEDKIPPLAIESLGESSALSYVNPAGTRFHLLDKVLSFDAAQEAVYTLPPPLILIGPAGSGKTALTLEKLKLAEGEVLYVTRSAYLAEHAGEVYQSNGYENERQQVEFLSFREYLETYAPLGRELTYPAFRSWFDRHRRQTPFTDAHRLYEEFQGVLTGGPVDRSHLARADYLSLGVRQSAFAPEQREAVFGVFEKYLAWLPEAGVTDLNLIAHALLPRIAPRYDFVVIDEVQDLTNVQLAAILASLKTPDNFLLCGDSNQIVHPNFFSWAAIKTLFYRDERAEAGRAIHILHANYRNSPQVTEIANRLLKIKQQRFGSIDRESNYLMKSAGGQAGEVTFVRDGVALRKELDEKTRASARVAVIVMRDEDKPAARACFRTPLLFSVHEAKGLEYEAVILWNFVSSERKNYAEIAADLTPADLDGDELRYARAKDKQDKSLDVYKFYTNTLYVALTRAVTRLYIVESDVDHPLLTLLGLQPAEQLHMARQSSSVEEWQREARRLEQQGKAEQAEAIRREVLHEKPVPWEVLDVPRLAALATQAFDPQGVSNKARERVFEYAVMHGDQTLAWRLRHVRYRSAEQFEIATSGVERKYLAAYEAKNFKPILALVDAHGAEFRTPIGFTPLMTAARAGNEGLVEALLARGADLHTRDNYGATALIHALRRASTDPAYARARLSALYRMLAPPSLALRIDGKLVKLERHSGEYFLMQCWFARYRDVLMRAVHACQEEYGYAARREKEPYGAAWAERLRGYALERVIGGKSLGLETADFVTWWEAVPDDVARPERRRRAYLSSLLAKHEAGREDAYNRRLFVRTVRGHYAPHPTLELHVGEDWVRYLDLLSPPGLRSQGTEEWRQMIERLAAGVVVPSAGGVDDG